MNNLDLHAKVNDLIQAQENMDKVVHLIWEMKGQLTVLEKDVRCLCVADKIEAIKKLISMCEEANKKSILILDYMRNAHVQDYLPRLSMRKENSLRKNRLYYHMRSALSELTDIIAENEK